MCFPGGGKSPGLVQWIPSQSPGTRAMDLSLHPPGFEVRQSSGYASSTVIIRRSPRSPADFGDFLTVPPHGPIAVGSPFTRIIDSPYHQGRFSPSKPPQTPSSDIAECPRRSTETPLILPCSAAGGRDFSGSRREWPKPVPSRKLVDTHGRGSGGLLPAQGRGPTSTGGLRADAAGYGMRRTRRMDGSSCR